jgi:TIR domain
MSKVFLSHSSRDNRQAIAVKASLIEHEPRLAEEIFLDLDARTGIRPGERWKEALKKANDRCEVVICLLSKHWLNSHECQVEFRYAENLHKTILCARLESVPDTNITSEWQRCDLFPAHGPTTHVDIADGEPPVVLDTVGFQRLLDALRNLGIGAEHFPWPPPNDPDRAPYRGWAPLEEADAAVFFGRDGQILRGLDVLHRMRTLGVGSLFVILGPSGAGKSSFLRAGLLPRLRRDDRRFLPLGIVRPERDVLAGANGFAKAVYAARKAHGLTDPALGDIETACAEQPEHIRQLLGELQETAHAQLVDRGEDAAPPTLVLPLDQAEELLSEGERQAGLFLRLIRNLVTPSDGKRLDLIVAASIRSDRFEALQTRPELADVEIEAFAELKPMPAEQFKEVITGPAERATQAGRPLELRPELVDTILEDCKEGSDTLPLLSLTLSRLYEKYGSSGRLTLAHYERMGGLRRVVQTVIDGILDPNLEVRRSQLESLRTAFIPWQVTINPINDKPMRRGARWSDLPQASQPLIDAFVANRLMVKDKREGEEVAEVALESLLRQWDDLAGWLDEERENLKTAYDVERAAAAWDARDRDEAWLLAGSRLAAADLVVQLPGYDQLLACAGGFLAASHQRVSSGLSSTGLSYDAFLCYAHRDREVASAIQEGLHKIGRRVGQLRALRVYRDATSLEANPDLWAKITEALHDSRFLIVVMSPSLARSHWCNEEVKHWLQHQGRQRLMLVLADGQLQWSAEDQRFDPERSTAAPKAMTEPGSLPFEPLYIDVSGDAPWDIRSPVFRDKVTSLAAPIHGKPRDGLASDELREQRRFRRQRRAAVAAIAVLIVVAVTFAVLAFVK